MNDLDPIACRVQEAFDREVTGALGRSALLTSRACMCVLFGVLQGSGGV